MILLKKLLLTCTSLLLLCLFAAAQTKKITGIVKDADGNPLSGVSIQVEGVDIGVITDKAGHYSINVPSGKNVLKFSYIDYADQSIVVDDRVNINVQLELSSKSLDNVVVIGYGTAKKTDLTGAVTKVKMEEFSKLSNVSVIQSLRGIVPGLNIGAVDGVGQNPSIGIRGNNSLSTSDAQPLIVVDGSIYRGSIIDLNPADIESIEILKDASSAAIYGSEASNGVMIVSTKKGGTTTKLLINYSGSYTMQRPSNLLVPMKRDEYEGFFKDATWLNSRTGPDYLQPNSNYDITKDFKSADIRAGYLEGQDNDWWGGLTRNGLINSHNISLRGKSKEINYFVSGGYTGVKGFIKNDDYKRYNYRINLDARINDWMKIGVESFLTSSDYSGAAPGVNTAFLLQPFAPITDTSGQLQLIAGGTWLNPYAELALRDLDKRSNIFGNIHADIKLPVNGLSYRINFSQNYRTLNAAQYNPHAANFTGVGYKNTSIGYDWSVDNILTFKRSFNQVHDINGTLVYGVEKRTGSNTNSTAQGFRNGSLGYNGLQAGDPALNTISTGAYQETSLYTMGRVLYSFRNKYMMTATLRKDGFSGFGEDRKLGLFPTVALGWVASNESFLKNNVSWLNYLKLRGSYGSTGNRGISRYQTLAILNLAPSYVFGDGGATTLGQYISSLANNELGWETTTGINLGIDFTIFNSRLSGNVDYYSNNTTDILYNIQLPTITGFNSIATNIGKVHNHGVEASVTGEVIRSKDVKWETTLVFSRNRDRIVSILGPDKNGVERDIVANSLFIGQPQGVVYNYEIIGMWQLQDQASGLLPAGFFPGTEKIADLNKDGKYSASDDKKILGYTAPSYRFSIVNRIDYKNFGLYLMINSVQGGKNYYMGDDSPYSSGAWTFLEQLKYSNVPKGAWDYWMPERPNAKYRRLDAPSGYNPRPYNQRSFIRLQDVSLSYTFNKSLISKYNIANLSIFVTGKNLVTLTKWKGWDPETGRGFAPGVPLMREYSFGLNLEF